MQPIVSLAFLLVYCAILWRWAADLREKLGPRLESYLDQRAQRRDGKNFRRDGSLGTAHVALLFAGTFLPVVALYAAAHFHAISWQRANTMLVVSLLLPAARFASADRPKERS